ncbi:MAG TPA: 23S rRNA (uracil(1939)-C(5))-methyltransferase RlmD, partial [Candidatus Udaeobacter sp.]|nr:23S rRNA (uracil(1939)-C(5))-methyltransferase RlmD [Candidatus Udaeobacter sp.]
HARYLTAEVQAVLAPGPARREPPCPYVATCGGCSWQHIDYPAQLAAKLANVTREFARLGISASAIAPPIAAPAEWGYRRRIRLHLDRDRRLGFLRPESRRVVEIDSCTIAEPALSTAIPAARRLVRSLRFPVVELELVSRGALPGLVMVLRAAAPPEHLDRSRIERFLTEQPSVTGVLVTGQGFLRTFGEVRVRVSASNGKALDVSPLAFSQVNPAANALLVGAVLAAIHPEPVLRVLELYAGAGNFTLALAPQVAALHAVERDRFAAEALARAAERLPGVTIERAAVGPALARLTQAKSEFEVVLADPPRSGLREELPGILALAPRRILYISCDLATLARDTRVLLGAGYGLTSLQLVDLFPQTHHAELVARFDTVS